MLRCFYLLTPQDPPKFHDYEENLSFNFFLMYTIKIKVYRIDSDQCCEIRFVLISHVILQPCTYSTV